MEKYNVAVIGGGPGGYVAAIRAAQLGNKTVLIEKDNVGGTCLNRGCIPTKALLHSAEVYQEMLSAGELGLSAENISYDYSQIAARKDDIVQRLTGGVQGLLQAHKVTLVKGSAALVSNTLIQVGDQQIQADKIILATGSVPSDVPIKGSETKGLMNSDEVLALTQLPDSAVIIGGGVIGIEFASLFRGLGKEVTVIEMMPSILTGMEEQICTTMTRILEQRGIRIFTGAKVTQIKAGLSAVFESGGKQREAQGAIGIIAVGRRPVTADMGLEEVGVKLDRGFVMVDDGMRTSVHNIYAIGDITGKIQLAHVASAQGLIAAHNASGENKQMSYEVIPSCIYTSPEIACVGLTEAQARAKGISVKTGTFNTTANGRSMIMGKAQGFTKLVTDAATGEILGAQIIAPRATDLIGEIAAVMMSEGTIWELSETVHPHPTISEIIMEAAYDVNGLCCHKV